MIIKILQKSEGNIYYNYITNVKVLRERLNEACLIYEDEQEGYKVCGLYTDNAGNLCCNRQFIYFGELIIDNGLAKRMIDEDQFFGITILNVEFYDGSKETYLVQNWFEYQFFSDDGKLLELNMF